MKRSELKQIIDDTFKNINDLNNTKGNEYASDAEALDNFYQRAKAFDLDPKIVWGIFFGKHVDSIFAYIRRGETLSESIESRIDDAILYLVLLKGLIEDRDGHVGGPLEKAWKKGYLGNGK